VPLLQAARREGAAKIDSLEPFRSTGDQTRRWRLAMSRRVKRPVEETMTRCLNAATACLLAVLGVLVQGPSRADEIVVLTNMGVVSAVRDLAPAFEHASGHKVIISFELGNAMMQKINSNAPADVVTQTPDVIDDLIKQGKVVGERVDFARAGIGVAVKAGAPKPDIGSADAFKRAMLAAKSIAYSRAGASGVYVAKLMQRLGIAEELKDKIKLVDGVPVAELVAKGEVEIGMQQINVILPVGGIEYVGPLPSELQGYVVFAAGILAVSKAPEAARAMAKFMAAPEAAPLIRKSGMEPATR
jgi:molybdate transport system substrate-binding protein